MSCYQTWPNTESLADRQMENISHTALAETYGAPPPQGRFADMSIENSGISDNDIHKIKSILRRQSPAKTGADRTIYQMLCDRWGYSLWEEFHQPFNRCGEELWSNNIGYLMPSASTEEQTAYVGTECHGKSDHQKGCRAMKRITVGGLFTKS